jgi:hypothetical protein
VCFLLIRSPKFNYTNEHCVTQATETRRVRTYLHKQDYLRKYFYQWSRDQPEFISRLDTQLTLDGNMFFWSPSLSLEFKLEFPMTLQERRERDAAIKTAQLTGLAVEYGDDQAISYILGKITIDITRMFGMLRDKFLGDQARLYVVNRAGSIVSAAGLQEQVSTISCPS